MPIAEPPEWCRASIWPHWANRWVTCGGAVNTATGRCYQYGHPRKTEEQTMTNQLGPDDPGAQDECATCGHSRWRHKEVDGQQVCTEYVDCACGGHFVELSQATRMARFVEAAQKVAGSIAVMRDALQDGMRATAELYTAMKVAGLLPEEEPHLCDGCDSTDHPVTATDDGRALLCPSCHRILKDQSVPLEASQPGGRHQRDSVCPLDGQPLEEVRMEDGKPTVYVHAGGITHLDRLPDLEEARQHEVARLAEALDIPPGMICGTPGVQHHNLWDMDRASRVTRAELETAPRYAQQASDSCATCWPYVCDTTRSMCRRRPFDAEQTTQPPEPTDMETTQTIPPYHPGHRSDCHTTCDGTLCGATTFQQPTWWHTIACDKLCGGTCMGLVIPPDAAQVITALADTAEPVMGTHQEPGYPPGRGPIRYPRSDEEATLDGATD